MPKRNLIRKIVSGEKVQKSIENGVNAICEVALASYGANSGNVMIEPRFGEPLISHDGITNVKNLVVEDSIENSVISVVRQASERTNRNAGDSTTLTIVLTKLAYDYWRRQDLTPREAQRRINQTVAEVLKKIEAEKLECNDELLRHVSVISAGDTAIGEMVADAVSSVGKLGSVAVVETPENQISSETINGFTFKKGLRVPALADNLQTLRTQYDNPAIIVLPKLISKSEDILPILDKCLRADKSPILLVADVSGQALETIVANKLKGNLDIAIVEPVALDRDAFLNDIAKYASTEQYTGNADDFDVEEYVGTVNSAFISLTETALTGCTSPDSLAEYAKSVDSAERRERLLGKTVRISVGAPTQAERQELKLRIEDAVCAARTAFDYGVLPGGGVFLKKLELDYFKKPFELLTNRSANDSVFKDNIGTNIETGETVDVVEAGIVDSAKAIEEAVINSHSAAAQLLSVKLALPFVEDME